MSVSRCCFKVRLGPASNMLAVSSTIINSTRAHKPCIEVDCPAIPRELFESELFGHEKGSFTRRRAARLD